MARSWERVGVRISSGFLPESRKSSSVRGRSIRGTRLGRELLSDGRLGSIRLSGLQSSRKGPWARCVGSTLPKSLGIRPDPCSFRGIGPSPIHCAMATSSQGSKTISRETVLHRSYGLMTHPVRRGERGGARGRRSTRACRLGTSTMPAESFWREVPKRMSIPPRSCVCRQTGSSTLWNRCDPMSRRRGGYGAESLPNSTVGQKGAIRFSTRVCFSSPPVGKVLDRA